MNMSNLKLIKLIQLLTEKTDDKKLKWEITADSNKYLTSLPEYNVIVTEEIAGYKLTITDRWDDLIEEVWDEDLEETELESPIATALRKNPHEQMKILFILARRSARNTDEAIDEIISTLE